MPNSFAYLMLAIWPIVTLLLFVKLSPSRALLASVLTGYLLLPPLPAAFDFPLVPPLSKETLPGLAAMVAAMLFAKDLRLLPRSRLLMGFIVVFILSPIATVATNPEPVVFVHQTLPGLGVKDALALVLNQAILLSIFLLSRALLASQQSQRELLVALVIAGLLYSLPMLIEIRLSPQLNLWVYGYYQHLFEQAMRGDGFRPLVFLEHGIWAAIFVMATVVAAVALWRNESPGKGGKFFLSAVYLGVVLVLCKTLGSLFYAVLLVPILIATSPRQQFAIASMIAVLALTYPVLKAGNLIPVNAVLTTAEAINPERAASLRFRLDNEDMLRERAARKPLFGWGSWGRNQLHDPVTGNITSVTDGRWIITFGVYGWVGFIAEFGLLALPILMLRRAMRRRPVRALSPYVAPLALLLSVNLLDLILNATLTPITWMLSGSLIGYAEALSRGSPEMPSVGDVEKPPLRRRTVL